MADVRTLWVFSHYHLNAAVFTFLANHTSRMLAKYESKILGSVSTQKPAAYNL